MTFRSKSCTIYSGGATGTFSTSEPAGAAQDDILLYASAVFSGSVPITAPTGGWAQAYTNDGSDMSVRVWWVRRGASAPGLSWSVTSAQTYAESLILAYPGCITTGTPYDDVQGNPVAAANPCNPDPPSATSAGTSRIAVAIGFGWGGEAGGGWTAPSGYTIRESVTAAGQAVSAADKAIGSGAENPAAFGNGVASANNAVGVTIILTPSGVAVVELPFLTMRPMAPPARMR